MAAYPAAGRNNAEASSAASDRRVEDERDAFRGDANARATEAANKAIRRRLTEPWDSAASAEDISRELIQVARDAMLDALPTAAQQMGWSSSGEEAAAFVEEHLAKNHWLVEEIERVLPAKRPVSEQPFSSGAENSIALRLRLLRRQLSRRGPPDGEGDEEHPHVASAPGIWRLPTRPALTGRPAVTGRDSGDLEGRIRGDSR